MLPQVGSASTNGIVLPINMQGALINALYEIKVLQSNVYGIDLGLCFSESIREFR